MKLNVDLHVDLSLDKILIYCSFGHVNLKGILNDSRFKRMLNDSRFIKSNQV